MHIKPCHDTQAKEYFRHLYSLHSSPEWPGNHVWTDRAGFQSDTSHLTLKQKHDLRFKPVNRKLLYSSKIAAAYKI